MRRWLQLARIIQAPCLDDIDTRGRFRSAVETRAAVGAERSMDFPAAVSGRDVDLGVTARDREGIGRDDSYRGHLCTGHFLAIPDDSEP